MSLKNGRIYRLEGEDAEFSKGGEAISNVGQHHQPMFKRTSCTRLMESDIYPLNTKKNPRRIPIIEEFQSTIMSWLYRRILSSLKKDYSNFKKEVQSGFRAKRSCTDNIFCLIQINEKKMARNQEIHL
jgi:hypothetical protein